ncbi:MAG TPA: hypothetical protein VNO82_19705 [Solirubrobacteraceae bacterium]|nr:hypothetical protein [Solirubrobacteraceae bacterium]
MPLHVTNGDCPVPGLLGVLAGRADHGTSRPDRCTPPIQRSTPLSATWRFDEGTETVSAR